MKAVVSIEEFAEWFVGRMGIELAPSSGVRAYFTFETNSAELTFVSTYSDLNGVSLDMSSWEKIFSLYFEYKRIPGYISKISRYEFDRGFGGLIAIEVSNLTFNCPGITFEKDN